MTLCFGLSGELPSRGTKGTNLRGRRPDLPQWFEDIIEQAIAEDPLDRFPSARRFAQALCDGQTGSAAPAAIAAGVARCVVCGVPEPFGAMVCEFCRSGTGVAADTLIVVRGEERSVARVPLAASEIALGRLRAAGRDAEAVPMRLSWTAIPLATWLLAALVCVAGFGAVTVGGMSGYWPTAVVMAGLLLSANQALRSPPASRRKTNALPSSVHDEMLTTLAVLSPGTARSLFCLLTAKVRAFTDLSERHAPAPTLTAGVHQLYRAACMVALDLDAADRLVDGAAETRGVPAAQPWLEQDRIRMVNRLLQAADQLDRVCRSTLAWNGTSEMDELTSDLAREVEAMEIVNRLLAERA